MGKKETKVVAPAVEEVTEVVETPVEIRKPHYREFIEDNVTVHLDKDPNDPRNK